MSSFQNNGWCGLDSVSVSSYWRIFFLSWRISFSITRNILGLLLPVSEGTEDILIWSHIFFFEAALVNIIRAHCARHATHVGSSVMIIIVLASSHNITHTCIQDNLKVSLLENLSAHSWARNPDPHHHLQTSFPLLKKMGRLIIRNITFKEE